MPKPINFWEFEPIWSLCIINIETHTFTDVVVSASNNHKQRTHKQSTMLIPFSGFRWSTSIWSFHPIKRVISMFSETPSISKRLTICPSASKNDHHSISSTRSADTRGMVYSGGWNLMSCFYSSPFCSVKDIDCPHIWNWLVACVTTINDQKRP